MSIKFLLIAFCLIVFAQTQEPPQDKMMLVEGVVETAASCPVALSEPKCRRPRVITPEEGLKEVHQEVKIENISGKAIRRAVIGFRHDAPSGGRLRIDSGTNSIRIGESVVFKSGYKTGASGKATEDYNEIFTVLVLAVEFEDGTHWVKPRTADDPLILQSLHRQPSPLVVRRCEGIEVSYRANLLTRSNQIVAYRLGVVKDLPDHFEVRLGEWMTMPNAATPERVEIIISAADPQVSLPQSSLFKRDQVRRNERNGSVLAGVALFVAEVKLVDGTIWKQNLTRDELMWGLHN